MNNHKECLIIGCNHHVPPQNEVDISVGIITSNEPAICEDCYMSEDLGIQAQIKEIEDRQKNGADGLPF